jgi:hypothetical protein
LPKCVECLGREPVQEIVRIMFPVPLSHP